MAGESLKENFVHLSSFSASREENTLKIATKPYSKRWQP